MKILEEMFLWIGSNFTPEAYLFYTKGQGLLWSGADILLVFMLLRISDLVRERQGRGKIRFRYFFLGASVVLTPLLLFTRSKREFFVLESVICGLQFAVLVYTMVAERKAFMAFFREMVEIKGNFFPRS